MLPLLSWRETPDDPPNPLSMGLESHLGPVSFTRYLCTAVTM